MTGSYKFRLVDEALTCRALPPSTSGFRIQRLYHEYVESDDYSSSRITDACVEGTSTEMESLALAIESGGSASFTRCAATREGDFYDIYSPRNSHYSARITLERAHELARAIRAAVSDPAAHTENLDAYTCTDGTPYFT